MSEPQQKPSILPLLTQRATHTLPAAGLILAIYLEGLAAYNNVQKAIQAKAVADNAPVKQHATAVLDAQKAKTEGEIARNAGEKYLGDADKAKADAGKLTAEAKTARQQALNAAQKNNSEAEAMALEVPIKRQKVLVLIQQARNAAPLQKALADKAEAEAQNKYWSLEYILNSYNLFRCPGSNYMEKIDAAATNRC